MPLTAYAPLGDPDPNHRRHRESRPCSRDLPVGDYVFVQDILGVVYVLSHFGKQESTADEHSLQNLLINFLVEANERRAGSPQPAAPAPPR